MVPSQVLLHFLDYYKLNGCTYKEGLEVSTPQRASLFRKKKKKIIFCVGSCIGEDFNCTPTNEKGLPLANKCSLCMMCEETTNHIFIHCDNVWLPWDLISYSLGIQWILPRVIMSFC